MSKEAIEELIEKHRTDNLVGYSIKEKGNNFIVTVEYNGKYEYGKEIEAELDKTNEKSIVYFEKKMQSELKYHED